MGSPLRAACVAALLLGAAPCVSAAAEPAASATATIVAVKGAVTHDGAPVSEMTSVPEAAVLDVPAGARVKAFWGRTYVEIEGPAKGPVSELATAAQRARGAKGARPVQESLVAAIGSLRDWLAPDQPRERVAALRGRSAVGPVELPVDPPSGAVAVGLLERELRVSVAKDLATGALTLEPSGGQPRANGGSVGVPARSLRQGPVSLVAADPRHRVVLATWSPLPEDAERALQQDLRDAEALRADLEADEHHLLRATLLARHGAHAQAEAELARVADPALTARLDELPWRRLAIEIEATWRASEGDAWRELSEDARMPTGASVRLAVRATRPVHLTTLAKTPQGWQVLGEALPTDLTWRPESATFGLNVVGEPGREMVVVAATAEPLAREGDVDVARVEAGLAASAQAGVAAGRVVAHGPGVAVARVEFEHVAAAPQAAEKR